MLEIALKSFFGHFWEDFCTYVRLYDFLKLRAKSALGRRRNFPSVASFWYAILGDSFLDVDRPKYIPLMDGDVIRLTNVFLTEWAPKMPGRIWTQEGAENLTTAKKHVDHYLKSDGGFCTVLDLDGKRGVLNAGFGSIRLNRTRRDPETYMYMALVDHQHWNCDYGIPVIVSRAVYNQFLQHSNEGAPQLQTVEGILRYHEDIPLSQFIPRAIGAELSPELDAALRHRPGLPKCYIHITSPLSLKFAYNDSHPEATAWTMFERKYQKNEFAYTYIPFQPYERDSVQRAVDFIRYYVNRYHGKRLITDFDGMTPRLEAMIDLHSNPMRTKRKEIKAISVACAKWTKQQIGIFNH